MFPFYVNIILNNITILPTPLANKVLFKSRYLIASGNNSYVDMYVIIPVIIPKIIAINVSVIIFLNRIAANIAPNISDIPDINV